MPFRRLSTLNWRKPALNLANAKRFAHFREKTKGKIGST